ncbi:L-seryl-tRNA(Ser) seleniumtransferase [Clostridium pascui]|uniref:L-seryl-tRNA(Sec) selenium transferase n=1 Tax=Clostridium pascui TaxID=46609 RepID=UPI00195E9B06|nr:L-seryl-tRNA(Sec) selenium transferase [Clostridium pascui]MBM7870198.1 L-seryl-tRNA(Ser) seleniumtransferase [Clostridium pascui]
MNKNALLRNLPKIDEVLKEDRLNYALNNSCRIIVLEATRKVIDSYREKLLTKEIEDYSKEEIIEEILKEINNKSLSNLRKVINATGVIIHTNLGRSILCKEAIKNVMNVSESYSNLEYNVEKGSRGTRYEHIEELITKLTGSEAALVVNNNAAAVMLALNTLCNDKEAIVSRGELVEIGGSFRVPDVMKFSGAKLVDVGTTNRTHLYDYENYINENTGVLLKVHTSNFKILGFTESVPLEEMARLGDKYNIPVMEDIGSGTLIDFSKYGLSYEPTVQESIKKGIDIVTFSGDKMLGGPQAGIIVGKKKYIDEMKKNQLTRALRIDKMTLAALEGTLKMYQDENLAVEQIPTLYMILSDKKIHEKRAYKLLEMFKKELDSSWEIKVDRDYSMVGGGSMPEEKISTYVVKIKNAIYKPIQLEGMLRKNEPPIIIRISRDEIIMDLRTIYDKDFEIIVEALKDK